MAKNKRNAQKRESLHMLIVEARFYDNISDDLLRGAMRALDGAKARYDCVTVPGTLPRSGSSSAVIIRFALSCLAAGGRMRVRKRSWSRPYRRSPERSPPAGWSETTAGGSAFSARTVRWGARSGSSPRSRIVRVAPGARWNQESLGA